MCLSDDDDDNDNNDDDDDDDDDGWCRGGVKWYSSMIHVLRMLRYIIVVIHTCIHTYISNPPYTIHRVFV
jgi:hypothetical protein